MTNPVPDACVADTPTSDVLHRRFLAVLPTIERHGHVYFRHLRCWHRLEEAVAEVVAVAWRWFVRLAEQGKDVLAFRTVLAPGHFRASIGT